MDKIKVRVSGRKSDFVEISAKLFGNDNVAVHKNINFWGLSENAIDPNYIDGAYALTHVPTGMKIWPNSFGYRRNAWACAKDVAVWFDQFCSKCQHDIPNKATIEQINELKAIIREHYTRDIREG